MHATNNVESPSAEQVEAWIADRSTLSTKLRAVKTLNVEAANVLVKHKVGLDLNRPLTPNDLWATVYKHLGINQDATINDYTGRPQLLLPFGEPIRELL